MSDKKREWKEAQKQAIATRDHLILVSAAAGSGKTSVLTERVIRRLLDPESPVDLSDLLIVTFTRAAAADLKSKIATALSNALEKDPGNERISAQLLQLGSAQISTIDSFYLQIVREHFESLGIPSGFRMADENELLLLSTETMDSLLPEFYHRFQSFSEDSSIENPLLKLKGNKFADCMDHIFGGYSGSDSGQILLEFYGKFSKNAKGILLLKESAELLRKEAEALFLQTHCGKYFAGYLTSLLNSYLRVLSKTREYHLLYPEDSLDQSGILAEDTEHCTACITALQSGDWEALRAALHFFHFRNFQTAKGRPEWSEKYKQARKNFQSKLKNLKEIVEADSDIERKEEYLQTAELAEMLYTFYAEFQERLKAEKLSRSILDFDDVRDALYQMLTNPQNEALLQSLQERYKEIYIDEYQDVDEIQDCIFSLIGKNHRFMVGDVKQSIYRFRGADPSVFTGYRKSMPLISDPAYQTSDAVCIFMSENFRCDKPIIDFANAVCSFLFSASPDSIGYLPQDDLQYAKPEEENPDFAPCPVQLCIFEKPLATKKEEKQEEEAEAPKAEPAYVAKEIASLLQNGKKRDGSKIEPGDIAILARKTSALLPFQKELEALGIPVMSSTGKSIGHSPVFMDLFNLLRAIDNPYRDLPLSEFLVSPLGGFTLEELQQIRNISEKDQSLYDALTILAGVEHPLTQKAAELLEWLEFYRRLSILQPADRFLRILYQDPRLQKVCLSPEYMAVYDAARSYQMTAWNGLFGFLNYLTRLWEAEKINAAGFQRAGGAVQTMTMHASKGLEFPVVFVVGCGESFKVKELQKPLIYQKELGFASNLFRPELGLTKPGILKKIAGYAISDDAAEDEVRLLYVSLTRARERLYVTASPSRKNDTLDADVSAIFRDDRISILSGKSNLDWILAALRAPGLSHLKLQINRFAPGQAEDPVAPLAQTEEQQVPAVADSLVAHYQAVLRNAQTTPYELDVLRGIPTKAAASKLKSNLLDLLNSEDETAGIDEQIALMRATQPSFQNLLLARQTPTAAEIGTATHQFLAFCDLCNLRQNGIDEEINRLVNQKFLSPEIGTLINKKAIQKLIESPLMDRIRKAKEIKREQQFSLLVPLSNLTESKDLAAKLQGHTLFVQGSIDLLLFFEDGTIELYDYKTDRIDDEERENPELLQNHLFQRHQNQLRYYAQAVEQLFGKRPDHSFIFSLSLGTSIELPI